jgi:hypothetical protein
MTLRQTINIITLTLAFLLLAPAGLILASWNSLPGDSLYPAKRTLEKIALAVLSPSYQTQTSFSTKLISRRLQEANATIDKKSSSGGLDQLKAQLALAQTQVNQAPTQAAKQQATKTLVTTLVQTKGQLETKKQVLIAVAPITFASPTGPSPEPRASPPPAPNIIEDIEAVQEQIDAIITDLGQTDNRGRSEDHRQDEDRGKSSTHRDLIRP